MEEISLYRTEEDELRLLQEEQDAVERLDFASEEDVPFDIPRD